MTTGDWLPAQAPFELVRRGYSPEQVTAHLERLEYDLRIATANRDATNQRLTELATQLSAAQGEADQLRAQLDRHALEPVSMAGLSDRMQRMIRLAEEEASDIRSRAQADAEKMRGELEQALAEAKANRAALDSERERTREQLAEQVHGLIAEATAEAEATRTRSLDEATNAVQTARAEADSTLTDARTRADAIAAEATATAEKLRTESTAAAEHLRVQSTAEAEKRLADAQAAAETAITTATQERDRLEVESAARRQRIDEDFDIAAAARRNEANRTIAEREAASQAEAHRLVTSANSEASATVAKAKAEADLLIQRATTYANALVKRAAAESHQRVADADFATNSLFDLRTRINDQLAGLAGHLDHIRELTRSAPGMIEPPAAESDRPRTEHFPPDAAARPTPVDEPVPVLETTDISTPPEASVRATGNGSVNGFGTSGLDGAGGYEADLTNPGASTVSTAQLADDPASDRPISDQVNESTLVVAVPSGNGGEEDSSYRAGGRRVRTFGTGRLRR